MSGSDVQTLRGLLDEFNAAVGSDARLRGFGARLNLAGGGPEDVVVAFVSGRNDALQRPWRWVASVCAAAARDGDVELVGRIAAMAAFWNTQIAPKMGPGDLNDNVVMNVPSDAVLAIHGRALEALPQLASDHVLFNPANGSVSAAQALRFSAAELLKADAPATLAESARAVLS